VLIGYANTESAVDRMVLQRSASTFVATDAEIFPRILQHAAYVDTYLEKPFVKASEPVSFVLEILLSALIFALGFHVEEAVEGLAHHGKTKARRWIIAWLVFAAGFFIVAWAFIPLVHASAAIAIPLSAALAMLLSWKLLTGCAGSAEFTARCELARNGLSRLAFAALALSITLLLARVGVFWPGSLVVVAFVLLEGLVEPILEYGGHAFAGRFVTGEHAE
jgi:hypothetical protein